MIWLTAHQFPCRPQGLPPAAPCQADAGRRVILLTCY